MGWGRNFFGECVMKDKRWHLSGGVPRAVISGSTPNFCEDLSAIKLPAKRIFSLFGLFLILFCFFNKMMMFRNVSVSGFSVMVWINPHIVNLRSSGLCSYFLCGSDIQLLVFIVWNIFPVFKNSLSCLLG